MSLIKGLKARLAAVLGGDKLAVPDSECATKRFGSETGGWDVATGHFDARSVVYSVGVGEGAEVDVIDDMRGSGIRPRQILVEFHHQFPGVGKSRTEAAIASLQALGYRLFSVSNSGQAFCFILQ